MKLQNLIGCEEYLNDIEIELIAFSTDDVKKNCLFFCLSGEKNDGHDFAEKAIEKGATVLVVDRRLPIDIPQVIVENTRSALSLACSAFYGHPSKKLKIVAVTGTNGKTTTTYIIKSILESAGKNVGIIGTNRIMIRGNILSQKLTTPDPTDLHRILHAMVNAGIEYVVMEASAHALALNKLDGILFEVVAFTNLSHDHLDYFSTMENYFAAKVKLFCPTQAKFGIVNVDDEWGRKLAKISAIPFATYGCYNPADVFAMDAVSLIKGVSYILNASDDIAKIEFAMPGRFNMYNSLCAAAVAKALNISIKEISLGIKAQKKVDGRFNIISTAKGNIIIDFAHTDDGLKNVLLCSQEFCTGSIITVFGCGGNRDKTKRPLMGQIAVSLSDYVIVTSDNPRNENPEDIISDIIAGIVPIGKTNYERESDRVKAITKGIDRMKKGDILIIAGKGAEDYQEISGVRYPYSDNATTMQILKDRDIKCYE